MKSTQAHRVPKSKLAGDSAAPAARSGSLVNKSIKGALSSSKGPLSQSTLQDASPLEVRDSWTTCASSPRLSDASCSDWTTSERMSSGETCVQPARTPTSIQRQNSPETHSPTISSLLCQDTVPSVQTRVLKGPVIDGNNSEDARNPRIVKTQSVAGTGFHPIQSFQSDRVMQNATHQGGAHTKGVPTRSPARRQNFPLSHQPLPTSKSSHPRIYAASIAQEETASTEKKQREHNSICAFPKTLSNRKILTRLQGALNPSVMYKYRCSAGSGIQVPVNRLETSPVKLSNWRVSWQELLCYNPRPYNITKGFLENYTVIRGMMETYIHKLTDIVFEDRCTATQDEPHIYHAYLLPPVRPHDWLTAACIQCYTSEDVWLSRGAWRRASAPNAGGAKAETMQPANPKVIPFFPAFTKEEQFEQQRQYRSAKGKCVNDGPACQLYDSSPSAVANKLPLHLWIFLGGKDMQALDGLVIVWKLLRWASEIPPSEFVESSEDISSSETPTELEAGGSTRPNGLEVYRAYHQQRRCPTQDQTAQAAAWACGEVPSSTEAGSNNLSAFGPFLYDMAGVSESSRYRVAFLMVDIPGYGNSTGHPSPCTIRSAVFQAVKHGIQELIEHHGEDSIALNILGYSLGCAVACSLAVDLASTFTRDYVYATPSQAANQQSWTNIATVDPELACTMSRAANSARSQGDASFDEGMLSFRDAFNVKMYSRGGVDHVCKIHGWTPSAGYSGIKLSINRLILLAPFTSTKAMASKVAASAVGGGSFLCRAVSGLVSKTISWDNKEQLGNLFLSLKHLQESTQVSAFKNFRIKILHGDKDNVIPWTMGFELFNTLAEQKKQLNLKIPIKFQRLHGETHATILCGSSERCLLESCFSPYRLHPAAPLALLKFYSKETHLPEVLPPRGIYSSTLSEVREMHMFGPQTRPSAQPQHIVKQQHYQFHGVRFPQPTVLGNHLTQQPVLAPATTLGGLQSHQQQAALQQLLYQRAAVLGVMPSQCATPQQQNSLFRHNGSLRPGGLLPSADKASLFNPAASSSGGLNDRRNVLFRASSPNPASLCSTPSQPPLQQTCHHASSKQFNHTQSQVYLSKEQLAERGLALMSQSSLPSRLSEGPR